MARQHPRFCRTVAVREFTTSKVAPVVTLLFYFSKSENSRISIPSSPDKCLMSNLTYLTRADTRFLSPEMTLVEM